MLENANFESYNSLASVESSRVSEVRMRIDLSIKKKKKYILCRIKDDRRGELNLDLH